MGGALMHSEWFAGDAPGLCLGEASSLQPNQEDTVPCLVACVLCTPPSQQQGAQEPRLKQHLLSSSLIS